MKQTLSSVGPARVRRGQLRALAVGVVSTLAMACSFGQVDDTPAIDDLPGDYRTAFLLHDVEGLSNPEIADTLSISLPAVKSRVHRSRLFLRQRLAEYVKAA